MQTNRSNCIFLWVKIFQLLYVVLFFSLVHNRVWLKPPLSLTRVRRKGPQGGLVLIRLFTIVPVFVINTNLFTLLYYNLLICTSLLCIGCVTVRHIKISWSWFIVWLFITESTLHVILVRKTRICYGCHICYLNCSRFFQTSFNSLILIEMKKTVVITPFQ